jgi:CRP-like cAMP-binding protein
MALFDAEPRSASVTTLIPSDCLVLTQQQLYEAIEENPAIAVNIIRVLSHRIRDLNQKVNTLQQTVPASPTPPSLIYNSANLRH